MVGYRVKCSCGTEFRLGSKKDRQPGIDKQINAKRQQKTRRGADPGTATPVPTAKPVAAASKPIADSDSFDAAADCSAEWESLIETSSDGGSSQPASQSSQTDSHSRPPAKANKAAPTSDASNERSVAGQSRSFEDLDVDMLIAIPTAEPHPPAKKVSPQQPASRPPQRSAPVVQPSQPSSVPPLPVASAPVTQTPVVLDPVPLDDDLLLNSVPLAVPSQFEQQLRPVGSTRQLSRRPGRRSANRNRNRLPSVAGPVGSIVVGVICSVIHFFYFLGMLLAIFAIYSAMNSLGAPGAEVPAGTKNTLMLLLWLTTFFFLILFASSLWLFISGIMELARQRRSIVAVIFAAVMSCIHLGIVWLAFLVRAVKDSSASPIAGPLEPGDNTTTSLVVALVSSIPPLAVIVLAIVRSTERRE